MSDHPASALVEVVVHLEVDPEDIPVSYQLLTVDIPDGVRFDLIEENELAADWRNQSQLTRELGDRWLTGNQTALLRVPSAIVPTAVNWLLNPTHVDSAKADIREVMKVPFDLRLLR